MALEAEQRYYMKLKAAYCYYEQDMTQAEIAQMLHISRLTLGRLLNEAREEGIVKIEIIDRRNMRHCLEAEADLRARYGLRDVKIVECMDNDAAAVNRQIGLAAARYVAQILKSGQRIGIGWGRTLEQMAFNLHKNKHIRDLEIITLLGGASTVTSMIQPNNLVQTMLDKFGGIAHIINAPYICQTEALCNTMKEEPGIRNALELSRAADITLIGVGEKPSADGSSQDYYSLGRETVEMLLAHGAVGDICAHFFDKDGVLCDTSVCRRVVSIDPLELKSHKLVIMMGGGANKREALLGALRGGYPDVLITDYQTAKAVLEEQALTLRP